ncbi:LacI family transcriptional regulator [Caproiciproducens sp. NJN-50]|uniref:LacI family DNA-binding transcriptional regulator n=1 Tax=Acutalibacteraceae TaxID=3082771 RepID=UPI000FFE0941|nr:MULTISPECIES: LacI family DNA-binding transcriptional regulator [Acutalibacteraceae]QAT50302.1 LacI family transcriptional regulator [Caproiciproducens sp. NJN-50]
MNRGITIVDVARQAGVSVTTVSRIINNVAYPVASDTREKVLKAIEALQYSPNKAAQGVRKNASDIIGLIVRDISDSYFGEIAKGVTNRASELGCLSFVCNTGRNPRDELTYHDLLWQHRVKGIILTGGGLDQEDYKRTLLQQMERHKKYGLRIITLAPQGVSMPYVMIDDFEAGRSITQYLIERGHRKIGFIGGPQKVFTSMERLRGYQSAMRNAGLDCPNEYTVTSDFSQTGGFNACQRLLQRVNDCTAICCANDNIAVGAMSAIRKLELKTPRDLSIISIGDISEAKYMHPPLTTLRIPHYEMGKMAVDYIVNGEEDKNITMDASIVERQSVRNLKLF